jgi:hypothetical protein
MNFRIPLNCYLPPDLTQLLHEELLDQISIILN